jgi:hypothetical protein
MQWGSFAWNGVLRCTPASLADHFMWVGRLNKNGNGISHSSHILNHTRYRKNEGVHFVHIIYIYIYRSIIYSVYTGVWWGWAGMGCGLMPEGSGGVLKRSLSKNILCTKCTPSV